MVLNMAGNTPQFKINQLAKDMGIKSKELTDLLATKGMEEVKSQRSLSEREFNLLLHTLTEANQITNIGDYMEGATHIPSKKAAAKAAAERAEAEKAAAEKAAAEKAAAEKAAAEKAAAEKAAAEKAAAEKAAAEKAAAEKAAAEKAAAEKAAAEKAAAEKAAAEKAAAEKAAAEKAAAAKAARPAQPAQTAPRSTPQRPDARQGDRPQGDRPARPQGDRPYGDRPYGDRPYGDRPYGDRPQAAQRPTQGQGQFDRRDGQRADQRGQSAPFGGRQGDRPMGGNRPQNDRGERRDNRGERSEGADYVPNTPREHFQVQHIVRGQTPKGGDVQQKPRGATRVVDTRAGDVDLSKYDERLDSFVSERVQDNGGSQRIARKPQQQQVAGRPGSKKQQPQPMMKGGKPMPGKKQAPVKKAPLQVEIPDEIVVSDLASRLKVTAAEVVKRLMLLGMMVTVNQTVDFDTAAIVADELGAIVTKEVVVTIEEKLFDTTEDTEENLKPRAPVVCVMGHVDHGKTSLLDAIRHTRVTAGEAGGITQHIGAYSVRINDQDITFLDTPGHEAFTAMRARGAQATDIAILVVAADDGIMPQTVEAINHAKAAGIDIIVAINKMDKPTADPDNIKQELTKYDLVPEEWGGDVICVPVSALTGMGLDDLLENVLLVAEVKELKANPDRRAKGIVIEAKLDKGRGPVATVLVQNGTLHSGDIVIAGTSVGRVRVMTDHTGRIVKVAGPSVPVEITGLADVPDAGDEFEAVIDERMARELAEQRRT